MATSTGRQPRIFNPFPMIRMSVKYGILRPGREMWFHFPHLLVGQQTTLWTERPLILQTCLLLRPSFFPFFSPSSYPFSSFHPTFPHPPPSHPPMKAVCSACQIWKDKFRDLCSWTCLFYFPSYSNGKVNKGRGLR